MSTLGTKYRIGLNYFCINCNEPITPTSKSNFCNKKCKDNYRNRIIVMSDKSNVDISKLDDNNLDYYYSDKYITVNKFKDKVEVMTESINGGKPNMTPFDLKNFTIGENTKPTNLSKNWGKKIPALLDTKGYAMSRSEILEALNMPSVQEVKQYCDRLVKAKTILQDYNAERTPKYLYTTQKALSKANK